MSDSRVSFELLDQIIVVESRLPGFIEDLRSCFEEVVLHPDRGGSADLCASVTVAPGAMDSKPRFEITSKPEKVLGIREAESPGAGWAVARALVQWAVAATSNYYVFHSGSVGRSGRGILLPGPTHSGKSTLTVALAQRGFDILSDEVGAIRAVDGQQIGFGRALSVREDVVAELGFEKLLACGRLEEGAHVLRASALGLSRASAVRPSLVVLPTFCAHAAAELRPVRPAAAVMALYNASCSQPRWKIAGLDFAIDLATRVPCFELSYSKMHDAARAIEEIFLEIGRGRSGGREWSSN